MDQPEAFANTEIDGVQYALYAMSPEKVIEHGNALISTVMSAAMGKAVIGDEASYGAAFAAVLQNLSHPALKAAIAELWPLALADGNPLGKTWKTHFTGQSGRMVRFLTWALEAQFADFFGSLIGVLKDAGAKARAKAEARAAAEKDKSSPNEP